MRWPIETFLGDFYTELREEYEQEPAEYHRRLYESCVPRDIQTALEEQCINDFITKECHPNDWVVGISLFVNVFETIRIYFVCKSDLRLYLNQLVNDKQFRQLVKVAFYISDTIHPKV